MEGVVYFWMAWSSVLLQCIRSDRWYISRICYSEKLMDLYFCTNLASQNMALPFIYFYQIFYLIFIPICMYASPHIYQESCLCLFLLSVKLLYYIWNLLGQETQRLESGQFQMVHVVPTCNHLLRVFMFWNILKVGPMRRARMSPPLTGMWVSSCWNFLLISHIFLALHVFGGEDTGGTIS